MQAIKITLVLVLILGTDFSTNAQEIPLNRYGLRVITDIDTYRRLAKNDSTREMVEVKTMIPSVLYELRYAGTDNFMKTRMYPGRTRHTFLRLNAARALLAASEKLREKGIGIKIWDAYRPYSVTERFWEMVKDERYVANPAKGSGHNRGVAVDLTLVDLKTGRELDMGTGFDNFSDTAHHVYTLLPEPVLQNRKLLKQTMESAGFVAFDSEWWHYSLPNGSQYEILDISFRELRKSARRKN